MRKSPLFAWILPLILVILGPGCASLIDSTERRMGQTKTDHNYRHSTIFDHDEDDEGEDADWDY